MSQVRMLHFQKINSSPQYYTLALSTCTLQLQAISHHGVVHKLNDMNIRGMIEVIYLWCLPQFLKVCQSFFF